jgi:hypothetical protein
MMICNRALSARFVTSVVIFQTEMKSGQRPDRKAGRGVWPAAGKLFSGLTFWLLLGQAKIAIAIMNTNKTNA